MLRINVALYFLLLFIVTLHFTRASVGVTYAPPPFSSTIKAGQQLINFFLLILYYHYNVFSKGKWF